MRFITRLAGVCVLMGALTADVVSAQGRTWQVGVVCPLTSPSKSFGVPHLQGVTLAFEQFRNRSRLKVDLQIVDDQSNPDLGLQAVENLTQRGVVAVLGPCNSSVAKKILQSGSLKVPLIGSLTTASELTQTRHPFFFRANTSDSKRVDAMLDAVFDPTNGRAPDHLVLAYEAPDPFGEGLLHDAEAWLNDHQRKFVDSGLVVKRSYKRGLTDTDVQPLLDLTSQAGSANDVWIVLGLSTDGKTVVKALREKSVATRIYLPGPEAEVFQDAARSGVDVHGVRFISVWDEKDARLVPFKGEFRVKFQEAATYDAALGYDGAQALLWALERVLPAAENLPIDKVRDRIRTTLEAYEPSEVPRTVLPGDKHFANGEYKKLDFVGLQFDGKGNSVDWNTVTEPAAVVSGQTVNVVLPTGMVFLLVGALGMLGSAIREIYTSPNKQLKPLLSGLLRPHVLIADPLIAVMVFMTLFVVSLLFYPKISEMAGHNIYYVAAVIGFLAGYLGVKALHLLLAKAGISNDALAQPKPAPVGVGL